MIPVNSVNKKMLQRGIHVPNILVNINMLLSNNNATIKKSIDMVKNKKKDAVLIGV